MKKSLLLVSVALLLLFACNNEPKNTAEETSVNTDVVNVAATAENPADTGNGPHMTFTEEMHDFGKITQGEKVSYAFKFKNTGKSDLIISDAKGSCGCTVPNYPKEPVKPGDEGQIDVTFNSEGKSGKTNKTVTLVTNCIPNTKVLTIYAEIIVPEEK